MADDCRAYCTACLTDVIIDLCPGEDCPPCPHCGAFALDVLGPARSSRRSNRSRRHGGHGTRMTTSARGGISRGSYPPTDMYDAWDMGAGYYNPAMSGEYGRNSQRGRRGPTPMQHPFLQILNDAMGEYIGMNGVVGMGLPFGASEEWMDQIAARLMEEYQPPSNPTAFRILSKLPTYAVRARGAQGEPNPDEACAFAGEPCTVCHDEFDEGEKVVELPCSHCFHKTCLVPWLETHNTCPVCRIELESENRS